MLDEDLKVLIERELSEIDALMDRSREVIEVTDEEEPSFERLAALSQILSSFYTGIERILERIGKQVDGSVPVGERWHSELLRAMAQETGHRYAVVSEDSHRLLREYLAFRHRSRHAYAHTIQWQPMRHLVAQLPVAWERARADLMAFLEGTQPEDV